MLRDTTLALARLDQEEQKSRWSDSKKAISQQMNPFAAKLAPIPLSVGNSISNAPDRGVDYQDD